MPSWGGARVEGFLAGLSRSRFDAIAYLTTSILFIAGAWAHLPYPGHLYSGLSDVFQSRECLNLILGAPIYVPGQASPSCDVTVPVVQTFIEYPVLSAMFLYVNAVLGGMIPGNILVNYYLFSAFFLFFPTLLCVRELLKLAELRGVRRSRVLWYFVVTPTLVFMVLMSWYAIGVWLALFGMRKYLGGNRAASGLLFGLSAAFNLVTAAPALGLLVASRGVKERVVLTVTSLGTYGAINLPFALLNSKQWLAAFTYIYKWNIENSWMRAFLSLYSPWRHYIPPVVFGAVIAIMLGLRFKRGVTDPFVFAFLSTFGYIFATYVSPPQLSLELLPFFVLLPVSGYAEFLAFDTLNSLIIIAGFSLAMGIPGQPFHDYQPVFWTELDVPLTMWIGIVRSAWIGRFLFFGEGWSVLPTRWRRTAPSRLPRTS